MKTEDYQKAKQLHEDAAKLVHQANILKRIVETGVRRISIQCGDNRPNDCFEVKDYNDDSNFIKNQPESVQTLLETFPSMLLAAYQRDINKIEKAFDKI